MAAAALTVLFCWVLGLAELRPGRLVSPRALGRRHMMTGLEPAAETYTIRLLEDAEVESAGLRECAAMFVDSWFCDRLSSEAQRAQIEEEIAADMCQRYSYGRSADASVLAVARWENGTVVGCSGVEVIALTHDGRVPCSWSEKLRSKPRAHLNNLAVARGARRLGIATALVRTCEAQARAWGFREQTLFVDHSNFGAISLYEELGYNVVSYIEGDKPIPRSGQRGRTAPGRSLVWQPTTNAFLVKELGP